MPKKFDIDGETFIVSEDVNLEELDTENMVQKKEPEGKNLSFEIKNKKDLTSKGKGRQHLPIKFILRYLKEIYEFYGTIILCDVSKNKLKYSLLLDTDSVIQIHDLFVKSLENENESNLFCRIMDLERTLEASKDKFFPVKKIRFLPEKNLNSTVVQFVLVSKLSK